jgi:hypothetical protein
MDFLQKNHSFPINEIDKNIKINMHGWFTANNQMLLYKYLKLYKPNIVCELGTWLGLSSKFICDNTKKDTLVINIDMWKGDESIGYTTKHDNIDLYKQYLVNMQEYKNKVFPIKMDGRKAIKYLYDNNVKLDLIYLDMGHTYENAIGDLETLLQYYPNVPILGDDYFYYDGVRKAVHEIRIKYKIPYLNVDGNCYALLYDKPEYNTGNIPKIEGYKKKELITTLKPEYIKNNKSFMVIIMSKKIHVKKNNNIKTYYVYNDGKNILDTFKNGYLNSKKNLDLDNAIIVFLNNNYDLDLIYNINKIPKNIISMTLPQDCVDQMINFETLIVSNKIAEILFNINYNFDNDKNNYLFNQNIIFNKLIVDYIYLSDKIKSNHKFNYVNYKKNKKLFI